jgi:pantothenate kinase type III
MKTNRVWIEIVILGTAIACGLALLLASLGAAAGAAEGEVSTGQQPSATPATTDQTYNGMVTCSRCGVKHSATLGHTAATCTRVCVHGGASFVLVDANATYLLEGDSKVLTRVAGQRAHVVGVLYGKTIKISSVAAEI